VERIVDSVKLAATMREDGCECRLCGWTGGAMVGLRFHRQGDPRDVCGRYEVHPSCLQAAVWAGESPLARRLREARVDAMLARMP
jgi:hypothetical protein